MNAVNTRETVARQQVAKPGAKLGANRGGRPKKAEGEGRSERFNITLTQAERLHIEEQASRAGLRLSEFMRRAILGVQISVKSSVVEDKAVHELNRIGVNLAQLLKAVHRGQTPLVGDIEATLTEVRRALEGIAYGS